jgi:hypothetical protein
MALLLSQAPIQSASEVDYRGLDASIPFVVEGVVGELGLRNQRAPRC